MKPYDKSALHDSRNPNEWLRMPGNVFGPPVSVRSPKPDPATSALIRAALALVDAGVVQSQYMPSFTDVDTKAARLLVKAAASYRASHPEDLNTPGAREIAAGADPVEVWLKERAAHPEADNG